MSSGKNRLAMLQHMHFMHDPETASPIQETPINIREVFTLQDRAGMGFSTVQRRAAETASQIQAPCTPKPRAQRAAC